MLDDLDLRLLSDLFGTLPGGYRYRKDPGLPEKAGYGGKDSSRRGESGEIR